jgi:hypothetical protein
VLLRPLVTTVADDPPNSPRHSSAMASFLACRIIVSTLSLSPSLPLALNHHLSLLSRPFSPLSHMRHPNVGRHHSAPGHHHRPLIAIHHLPSRHPSPAMRPSLIRCQGEQGRTTQNVQRRQTPLSSRTPSPTAHSHSQPSVATSESCNATFPHSMPG